jgi:hypothetical protein
VGWKTPANGGLFDQWSEEDRGLAGIDCRFVGRRFDQVPQGNAVQTNKASRLAPSNPPTPKRVTSHQIVTASAFVPKENLFGKFCWSRVWNHLS